MSQQTEVARSPAPPPGDPYFYGWRMVPRWNEGGPSWEQVPLTEWDVLHPEEGDFIVQSRAHDRDVRYVSDALETALAGENAVIILTDHRIDWQTPGLRAHCPDVVVFEDLNGPWDSLRATFPVKEMAAKPALIVEVTSPSTRYIDLDEKVVQYHRAGVPVYVIVDRRELDGRAYVSVIGYRSTPDGYVRIPVDERNGLWVDNMRTWIKPDGDRVACLTADRQRYPDMAEMHERECEAIARAEAAQVEVAAEQAKAKEATAAAHAERARADEAARRADEERLRADDLARRTAELEAELRRLRSGPNPNTDTPTT